MNRWFFAVFLLSWTNYIECEILNCCSGENVMRAKKCVEGSLSEVLPCPNRFLLNRDEVQELDETEGILSYGELPVYKNDFCRTTSNNSEVFIICHYPDEIDDSSNIFVYFGFFSSFCLFLTISIYLSLPKLLDLQGICITHSILGLAFGFIIMGINRLSEENSSFICQLYAYSLYFSFLYSFFWLNTYCFHLWRTTIEPKLFTGVKRWQIIYHIYGCGFPILLLSVVFICQKSNIYLYIHPRMAEEAVCWFGTLAASFAYLYIPISILFSMNILFFFSTIHVLWTEIHKYDGRKSRILKYRLSLCIKLFFIMGISWVFEVISAAFEHKYPSALWKISDTVNSLQGLLIFLIMVVFRKRVHRLLAEKTFGKMLPQTWKSIDDDEDAECSEEDSDYKLDQVNPL